MQQTQLYNNLYKPTYSYPFAKLWGEENARIAKWLKERNRVTKALTAKDYEDSFDTHFMAKTYEKLGWKIPAQAPFLPANWNGKIGQLPYPAYANANTLKEPQPWPEPGRPDQALELWRQDLQSLSEKCPRAPYNGVPRANLHEGPSG